MKKGLKVRKKSKTSVFMKVTIFSLFLLAVVFNIYALFFNEISKYTGYDISPTALVSLFIEADPDINITSPLNITYNFGIGGSYILDLNVTSDMPIDTWNYRLYDNKHGEWTGNWVVFSPNTSFNAVRWSNTINAVAYTPSGKIGRDNETFFVSVPNSAPIIYDVNSTIQVCEGQSLFYQFYAIDLDEDENPIGLDTVSRSPPSTRFFVQRDSWLRTLYNFSIFSGKMGKSDVGGINGGYVTYPSYNISVSDGEYSDSKMTSITIIEKNNAPTIEDIAAKTIWNRGENSTLYEVIDVSDLEFDNGYGNLTFSVSTVNGSGIDLKLFNASFNSTHGIINFTAGNFTPLGGYNVTVCVNDTGLSNQHSNISIVCNQSGSSIFACDSFSLSITDNNRPPTIIDYNPKNLTLNVSGTNNLYFNVTKYDPDGGIPDAYWYVDGVFKERDEGSLVDEFNYAFECEITGVHTILVNVSDGLLVDSLGWGVLILPVGCDTPSGGGGGGGGSSIPSCLPQWGCDSWGLCQNAEASLNSGLLSGDDYRIIQDSCNVDEFESSTCGFQVRNCRDVKDCFLSSGKPEEIQYCHYTENPSCSDKLKNCHNGDCELLVDCGGPCNTCPSCTDKKKNQGEEGVDCGGPCPWRCVPSVPLLKRKEVIYGFLILLLLLIVLVIIKFVRVLRENRALAQQKRFPN